MGRTYGTLEGGEVVYRWAKATALQNGIVPTALPIYQSENQTILEALFRLYQDVRYVTTVPVSVL